MPTKENTFYSRTSKEAVIVPDSVWKQILSPEVYAIAREKGTERPFTSAFETSKAIGHLSSVKLVVIHCLKVIPNLIAVVAGLVFTSLLQNNPLSIPLIIPMECKEPKYNAVNVKHI